MVKVYKKFKMYAFDAVVTSAQGGSLRLFYQTKKKSYKRFKN